jgi:hypothetical protein
MRVPVEREHYDLREDPQELAPRRGTALPPELVSACQLDPDPGGRPESARRGASLDGPKVAPRASPEALEKLRALGYVE